MIAFVVMYLLRLKYAKLMLIKTIRKNVMPDMTTTITTVVLFLRDGKVGASFEEFNSILSKLLRGNTLYLNEPSKINFNVIFFS